MKKIAIKRLGRARPPSRPLSLEEVTELLKKLGKVSLPDNTELALKIMLATACRLDETLSAEWRHVCLDKKEWHIPAEITKTGERFTVSLSDYACGLFERQHELTGTTTWVFANSSSTGPVLPKLLTKLVTERQTKMQPQKEGLETLVLAGGPWVPRDLRRAAEAIMEGIGVNKDIVKLCLNNSAQLGIPYVSQENIAQMKNAWQVLGKKLEVCEREAI